MVDRIGRYTIVAELGRGGMGVVYKAHEESLNRFVALKVLGEHLTEDPAHVERFLREAQSAARLNHPNIVQIYAIGEDAGRHFFVMEHVTGQSLQKILRARGPLDSIQTARIALQAASGLHAAHQHGIIHRDIKPANLLIDDRGLLKIADFGLALMGGAASRLTATGMFMGTPGYLSPEQCLDQNIDHRTDIYSLGVTIFETLSGKAPFRGDSPLALLRQIIEVEPPDLGELAPGVDPELRALVARMMAKDRERRVASCAEIIMALEAQLAARGVTGSLLERLSFTTGGGPPPSPASAEDLESRPTTAVSGDLPTPPAPTVTAPASPSAPPLIESVPIEPAPRSSGGRLALIAALVVVFGLAAVVLGGVSAWRSGLFSVAGNRVANRAEQPASTSGAAATIVADEAETLPVEEVGTPASVPSESSTTTARSARETTAAAVNRPTLVPEGRTAGPVSAPPPERVQAGAAVEASGRPPADPPHPPEGTVVIAVGEQLLAGEVEAYIEAALTRAGVPLVDEHGIPGIGSILTGDEGPSPGVARDLLQPHARNLVMVRVEHLGERPLVYMGQRDVAFQARVSVVPIDIASGTPIQQPTRFRIEYTHLNAGRVVEKELRQPTARIVKLLDEY
jgi:serine/threonine-protein kinase